MFVFVLSGAGKVLSTNSTPTFLPHCVPRAEDAMVNEKDERADPNSWTQDKTGLDTKKQLPPGQRFRRDTHAAVRKHTGERAKI